MAVVGSPDVTHESFWELLSDLDADAVKNMCPPGFDWNSLCPVDGITPLIMLVASSLESGSGEHAESTLDLASWIISKGADPTVKAPLETQYVIEDEKDPGIMIEVCGQSAIMVGVELRQAMELTPNLWELEIQWLRKLMAIMTRYRTPNEPLERTPIYDGVISMWEQVRKDTASHDIVFEASDGTVGAHACVLTNCSLVLAAMLRSDMSEGRERRIIVKESSCQSLHLLLDLAYAGSTSLEFDFGHALLTLDLAHRWQLHTVVMMLQGALIGLLSEESFSSIAEAAQLKGLPLLIESCKKFGTSSKFVQEELKAGRLPAAVSEMMGVSQSKQAKKRRAL